MTLNNPVQNTTPSTWTKITVLILVFGLIVTTGVFIGTHSSFQMIQVNGDSMEPTLMQNDYIIGFENETIEENDVILIENDPCFTDGYVVHRVVSVTDNGFITQGDNNVMTDQQMYDCDAIDPDNVISKIEYVTRTPSV